METKSPGPLALGSEGRCVGPLEREAGARLSWSGLFFPLLVASGGSRGAEWAEVGGQGGMPCLLPALARLYLPAQPHLALRYLITDHTPGKEVLRLSL